MSYRNLRLELQGCIVPSSNNSVLLYMENFPLTGHGKLLIVLFAMWCISSYMLSYPLVLFQHHALFHPVICLWTSLSGQSALFSGDYSFSERICVSDLPSIWGVRGHLLGTVCCSGLLGCFYVAVNSLYTGMINVIRVFSSSFSVSSLFEGFFL